MFGISFTSQAAAHIQKYVSFQFDRYFGVLLAGRFLLCVL
jgi:hypothetical protein